MIGKFFKNINYLISKSPIEEVVSILTPPKIQQMRPFSFMEENNSCSLVRSIVAEYHNGMESKFGVTLFIPNIGKNRSDYYIKTKNRSLETTWYTLRSACSYVIVFKDNIKPIHGRDQGRRIYSPLLPVESIILPKTFDKDYEKFLSQNKKILGRVFNKYCTPSDNLSKYMYCICNGNANYFIWAIKNYSAFKVRIDFIYKVMVFVEKYSNCIGELSLKNIVNYNGLRAIMGLLNEINNLILSKQANKIANDFNTAQKKILKEQLSDINSIKTLGKFSRLSKSQKRNFIRKVSTMYDPKEILHLMSFMTSPHFEWSKKSVVEFLENVTNLNYRISYDKDNILVVETFDFETTKHLAKTTNWCISKNRSYWNQYMENNTNYKQFILFDFDKQVDTPYSIIGFTLSENGFITHAHNFNNKNILRSSNFEVIQNRNILPSWAQKINNHEIHDILYAKGINVDFLIEEKPLKLHFDWNKESLCSFIEEMEIVIDVKQETDTTIVFSSRVYNILSFLFPSDQCYYNLFAEVENNVEEIWFFFDFSHPLTTKNNFNIVLVGRQDNYPRLIPLRTCTAYGKRSQINFEKLMSKYDLSSERLCGLNSNNTFCSSILSNDYKAVIESLTKENLDKIKDDEKVMNNLFKMIRFSIFGTQSFALVNLLKEKNINLTSYFNNDKLSKLIFDLIVKSSGFKDKFNCLSFEEFQQLNNKIDNPNTINCLAYGHLVYLFKDCFHDQDVLCGIFKNWISHINACNCICSELHVPLLELFKKENLNLALLSKKVSPLAFYIARVYVIAVCDNYKSISQFLEEHIHWLIKYLTEKEKNGLLNFVLKKQERTQCFSSNLNHFIKDLEKISPRPNSEEIFSDENFFYEFDDGPF